MDISKEVDISIVVLTGTAGMSFLVFGIILFYISYQRKIMKQQAAHQQMLMEAIVAVQECERKKISEDLHDDLGALLSIIKMKACTITDNTFLIQSKEIENLTDEAIGSIKKISRLLSPVIVEKYGLERAICDFIQKISCNNTLNINYQSINY